MVLHSERGGYRGPAADKLGEQKTVGVRLELHEVSAGGEGGHGGVRASDYVAVSAGCAPPFPARGGRENLAHTHALPPARVLPLARALHDRGCDHCGTFLAQHYQTEGITQ